jgi:hypothetical protein
MGTESQDQPVTGGLQVKGVPAPGGGKFEASVSLSPDVYENMKAELERRSGGLNSFLEGMKDAVAITSSNPMAMVAREKQKDEQRQQALDMRLKLATWEAAQKANERADIGLFGPIQGTTPSAASAPSAATTTGAPVPAPQLTGTSGDIKAAEVPAAFKMLQELPEAIRPIAEQHIKNRDRAAFNKLIEDNWIHTPETIKQYRFLETLPDSPKKDMAMAQWFKEYGQPKEVVVNGVTQKVNPWEYYKNMPKPAVAAPAVASEPAAKVVAEPTAKVVAPAAPAAPAAKVVEPTAKVVAPAASSGTTVPSTIGGLPSNSEPGIKLRTEDYGRSQESIQKNVIDKLYERSPAFEKTIGQVDRALIALENANTGPGTVIKQTGTELKGVFKGLEGKELDRFVNTKILDQTQKQLIGSNLKAVYGGNPSNTEGEKFEKTLFSINDPKQFIRAALELAKVDAIYGKETLSYLSKNKSNTTDAYDAWQKSNRYNELIKQYAPTISKQMGIEPTASAKAAVPPLDFGDLQTQRNRNRAR